MKHKLLRIFCLISAIEGLMALLFLFWIPSMEKNATLLGYSPLRLFLGIVILIPLVLFTGAAIKAFRDDNAVQEMDAWLEKRLVEEKLLLPCAVAMTFDLLFGAASLYLYFAPVSRHLGMLIAVLERMMSLVTWIMLLSAQGLGLILGGYIIAYRHRWGKQFDLRLLFDACLVPVILLTAVAHWAVFYFRLELFINIPDWFWKFQQKAWTWKDFIFVAVLGAGIGIITLVIKSPGRTWRNLILLMGLGVVMQVSYGFIDGGGLDSIRQKYANTDHSAYARQAVNEPDLIKTLTDYENLYGGDYYMGTKPPGLMAVYILAEKLTNIIQPALTNYERYLNLTWFIAWGFPWISMLVIIPLYFISRRFFDHETSWFPVILYISCSSVLLMPLFMDQVLYPLLLIGSLLLGIKAIESNSFKWALAGGAIIYTSLYISFSLLPVIGLILAWLGIRFITPYFSEGNVDKLPWARLLKVLSGLIAGWLSLMMLWRWALNYDFFSRYLTAMAQHVSIRHFFPGPQQIRDALVLNNAEFAVWAGFPLIILFLWQGAKSLTAIIRLKASLLDGMTIAFVGTYIVLNLTGQTKGEVGRLWIFLMPMVALLSAGEIKTMFGYMSGTSWFRSENRERTWKLIGFILVFTLQSISALVIFHSQDLNGLYFTQ